MLVKCHLSALSAVLLCVCTQTIATGPCVKKESSEMVTCGTTLYSQAVNSVCFQFLKGHSVIQKKTLKTIRIRNNTYPFDVTQLHVWA